MKTQNLNNTATVNAPSQQTNTTMIRKYKPAKRHTMNPVRINMHQNGKPVVIDMIPSYVIQGHTQNPRSSRLLLVNDDMTVCITLDPQASPESLAKQMKRKNPPVIQVGDPIIAIHVINHQPSWPNDRKKFVPSIFNTLPAEDWVATGQQPIEEINHPMLPKPPGVLVMRKGGCIISLNYSSVEKVDRKSELVFITTCPGADNTPRGHVTVSLATEELAERLEMALNNRKVRVLVKNGLVKEINFNPLDAMSPEERLSRTWKREIAFLMEYPVELYALGQYESAKLLNVDLATREILGTAN